MTMLNNKNAEIVKAIVPASRDYMQTDVNAVMPSLLVRKKGTMNSFVAIHEPVKGEYLLKDIKEIEVISKDLLSIAVQIEDLNKRKYLILNGTESESVIEVKDAFQPVSFKGQLAVLCLKDEKLIYIYMANARSLTFDKWEVTSEQPVFNILLENSGGNRWRLKSDSAVTVNMCIKGSGKDKTTYIELNSSG